MKKSLVAICIIFALCLMSSAQVYAKSPTAKSEGENHRSNNVMPEPTMSPEPIMPPELQRQHDIGKTIRTKGFFYENAVGAEDEEVTFGGYDVHYARVDHDFLELTQSEEDRFLHVLSMDEIYDVHVRVCNLSEDEIAAENVNLSVNYMWSNRERLRLYVYIAYGESSRVAYAEDFAVYNPEGAHLSIEQADTDVRLYNAGELLQQTDCAILSQESFAIGFEEQDGTLPSGKEYLCELVFPIRFTVIEEEQFIPPASETQEMTSAEHIAQAARREAEAARQGDLDDSRKLEISEGAEHGNPSVHDGHEEQTPPFSEINGGAGSDEEFNKVGPGYYGR